MNGKFEFYMCMRGEEEEVEIKMKLKKNCDFGA